MLKPLPLLLMTLQSLSLLTIVSVFLLTPEVDGLTFLGHISQALWVLLASAGGTVWMKLEGRPGHSPLLAATSVLFVLGGPIVLAGACTLGLDSPELWKVSLCALLVYLTGCLFYWVSLGDEEDLIQLF